MKIDLETAQKAKRTTGPEKLENLAKEENHSQTGQLADDELDGVTGGACGSQDKGSNKIRYDQYGRPVFSAESIED